jgi:glycine/D-amino acid oxidase-like deaminating enzyme
VTETDPDLDLIIIGGGVAGLWTLNHLNELGYSAVLLEADRLGCEQTLASQGMIHGGIKYALGGTLTGASEAIASMPDRWREALAGRGSVDLTGLEPLAERYCLFADGTSIGRLTTFFASRALRGRIDRLTPADYPEGLAGFDGVVYGLKDFVLDTRALITRLRAPVADRIFRLKIEGGELKRLPHGWELTLPDSGRQLTARRLALCAGAGNGPLINRLALPGPGMQLRPLNQVLVRHPALKPLYAHCVTGIRRPEPRLTITSHEDSSGGLLWYLGGQLATDGVERSEREQLEHAHRELSVCVPWIDWSGARMETLRVDRAEPAQVGGRRPDEAYVRQTNDCLICWPTKLSLAPDLADRLTDCLQADFAPPPQRRPPPELPLPRPEPGQAVWMQS